MNFAANRKCRNYAIVLSVFVGLSMGTSLGGNGLMKGSHKSKLFVGSRF